MQIKLHGSANIILRTWNNLLSDIEHSTLIPQASSLYETLSEMNEGALVVFSGRFFYHRQDHVYESSISEKGAMTEPEFIMRFSAVRSYVPGEQAEPALDAKQRTSTKKRKRRPTSRPARTDDSDLVKGIREEFDNQ